MEKSSGSTASHSSLVSDLVGAAAASCGSGVGEAEWEELARGSDALRKLVRIKVQDDNDLKAANLALKSCAEFFDNLKVYATRNSLEETAVLTKLEE